MVEGKYADALSDLAIAEKLDPNCTEIKDDRAIIEQAQKKGVFGGKKGDCS